MNQRDDGGPAFPMQEPQAIHAYASAKVVGVEGTDERDRVYMRARAEAVGGMSLRDYLAAKAMHAMTTGSWPDMHEQEEISVRAYRMADAMLKARKS